MGETTESPRTICPQRFEMSIEGCDVALPCCWSHPLDERHEALERAIIVIHGVLRNADEYFPNMMAAIRRAGKTRGTLVIAPQFLLEEDVARFNLPEEVPFWGGDTGEAWKKGDPSLSTPEHPRPVSVSSFQVIDQMILRLANQQVFPNLKAIVVAGHSAGGQFVNRYAAGTAVELSIPAEIHLRFIVANPSTYLYFDGQRRVGDATSEFALPENAGADYDDYKYGLKNLNPYMAASGADQIRARYPHKDVVYLLGGEDTRQAHLEQTPNAMLQGANRLERGQVYYHYLKHFFGEGITAKQKIAIIPCVGHDNAAIFKSEAGIRYLFS